MLAASRSSTVPLSTISEFAENDGGAITIMVTAMKVVAEAESVTVRVSWYVPMVLVSEIRITGASAVEVSSVIPEIEGVNVYRCVAVPPVTVKVSTFATLIAFCIVVLPVRVSAGLMMRKTALLVSVILRPAVSESVTITRY